MGKLKEVCSDPAWALPNKDRWTMFIPTFVHRLQDNLFLTCLLPLKTGHGPIMAEYIVKHTSTDLIPLFLKTWPSVTHAKDGKMLVWPVVLCGMDMEFHSVQVAYTNLALALYAVREGDTLPPYFSCPPALLKWSFHSFRTCPCPRLETPPCKSCSLLYITLVTADMIQ